MFNKVMLSALGLAAAVAAPIAYFSASDILHNSRAAGAAPATTAAYGSAATAKAKPLGASQSQSAAAVSEASLEGLPVADLAEVFQFQATPEWIMQRWPRVSTGLAQLQLQGYRVPLVTGTAETDLAGSLTYYFNAQQQLQQIDFHGSTGDARKLVGLLTGRYHLVRRLTNDPGLAVYEAVNSNGQRTSSLWIHAAPVIRASQPRQRFDVQLALQRPEE